MKGLARLLNKILLEEKTDRVSVLCRTHARDDKRAQDPIQAPANSRSDHRALTTSTQSHLSNVEGSLQGSDTLQDPDVGKLGGMLLMSGACSAVDKRATHISTYL